jgi:hypothetical protein
VQLVDDPGGVADLSDGADDKAMRLTCVQRWS